MLEIENGKGPEMGPLIHTSKLSSLEEQVAFDLKKALACYSDETIGMRLLANKMCIHKRTLTRILKGENRPGYLTLYKIYRVLYDTKDDTEILDRAPELVKAALRKGNPKPLNKEIIYRVDVEEEIKRDRSFAEIYLLAGCGPVTKELISYRFGQHGLEVLRKMLAIKVLELDINGQYVLGSNQANLSAETIKMLGVDLTSKFSRPSETDELGENFMGLYAEGLNEEGYNEWLKIEEEAYQKKIELANSARYRGNIKAFTFQVTDKLSGTTRK